MSLNSTTFIWAHHQCDSICSTEPVSAVN